jgi:hypothetical protein
MSRILFALSLIFLLTTPTKAHEWYPHECCHDEDCHPVACEEITETKEGYRWNGYFFRKDQSKPSQDNKCHVCIFRKNAPQCIFLQQNT